MRIPSIRLATASSLLLLLGLAACSEQDLTYSPVGRTMAAVTTVGTIAFAGGVTAPSGGVWIGTHLWISDHLQGFCRIDNGAINQLTCNTNAKAPGQPSAMPDPANANRTIVFVPDLSSKSQGVWRLTIDATAGQLGQGGVVASTVFSGTAGVLKRADASALSLDNSALYIGTLRSGGIYRVTDILGRTASSQIGTNLANRSSFSLAVVGNDLYIADKTTVSVIRNVSTCSSASPCTAVDAGFGDVNGQTLATGPVALATNGTNVLYISDSPAGPTTVYRMTFNGCSTDGGLTQTGTLAEIYVVGPENGSGLTLRNGDLYIGDDPSAGALVLRGHVWYVPAGSAVEGTPGCDSPPTPGGGGGIVGPGGSQEFALGLTVPAGVLKIGLDYWVSDHLQGFCKLIQTATGTYQVTPGVSPCILTSAGGTFGQPSYDGSRYVYLADNTAKSQGVLRCDMNTSGFPCVILALSKGLGGNRPSAALYRSAAQETSGVEAVYVSFLKNGSLYKITSLNLGNSAAANQIGQTSDGRPTRSMTFVDKQLFLAEARGVSVLTNPNFPATITDATSCPPTNACKGSLLTGIATTILAPSAVGGRNDAGAHVLYIGDTPGTASTVYSYDLLTPATQPAILTSTGTVAGNAVQLLNVSNLNIVGGSLFISDDPSAGANVLQGRVFSVTVP